MMKYMWGVLWCVFSMNAFHLQEELASLMEPGVNELKLYGNTKKNVTFVRFIEVLRRDVKGIPLEFQERYYFECARCKEKTENCRCSVAALSSTNVGSPLQMRKDRGEVLPQAPSETVYLLSVPAVHTPRSPNRLMQALAVCVSFPALLCALCSTNENDEVSSCYAEHVAPYGLPEPYSDSGCCNCLYTFCPCCVPQEEL